MGIFRERVEGYYEVGHEGEAYRPRSMGNGISPSPDCTRSGGRPTRCEAAEEVLQPIQAYCERSRTAPRCSVVKGEASSDRIDEDIDELELWQSSWEDGDNKIRDPISYWHERRRRYPRLSRTALDFLTVQPMLAECERLSAAVGRIVTPLRSRLDAEIMDVSSLAAVVTGWGDRRSGCITSSC